MAEPSNPLLPAAAAPGQVDPKTGLPAPDPYNEKRLLDLFDKLKREAMESRWVWEREWLRDLYYVGNRQWITYHPTRREWIDKRLQKWIPRPVTNKMAETVQAIRTNLGAITLSVKARPIGNDTQSVSAAEIADQMAPLIHEEHIMNQVMRESDFWLITTGNAVMQVSWNKDSRFNRVFVPHEQCVQCGIVLPPQVIAEAGNTCPQCGSQQFMPAKGPDGKPIGEWVSFGRGKTTALSPFEYAFPSNITRFDDLPYIIRLRWRDKHWFESNMPEMVKRISWEKSPADRSLQIFKSLALANDVGTGSQMTYSGAAGSQTVEGVTEYELWLRPTPDFEEGLVMRVVGDKNPVLLRVEAEGLPGPFPYKDVEGSPIFPFVHAQYEHMGGRLLGRSAISPLIQKQDQLNQLDSLIQLHIQRNSNAGWVIPEGAGIDQSMITGEPGLIIRWSPLAAGGNNNAKPERVSGVPIDSSLFEFRAQILSDIEQLSGAFDIIKGQKPTGVEAFSALQLLVERSQSRFTSVFQARGEMYRKWFGIAIELERQFGPEQRVWSVVGPNRGYSFKHFENAQLQGQITFQIEDGSNMPKTALGKRAAIEQANQLGLLDPNDPDQKYALLTNFGLSDLVPTLNFHVQAALQVQDAFEKWIQQPEGLSPLEIKPWYDPHVHWVERIKWLNADKMREFLVANPQAEPLITMHLQQLQMLMAPPVQLGPDGQPIEGPPTGANAPGGGQSMTNSNRESGATDTQPKGTKQFGPNVGPS